MRQRGVNMHIAFEGIDGSGKSTQLELLTGSLKNKTMKPIYRTKQPTNFYRSYDRYRPYVEREISTEDSKIIYELALLSAADKIRHYELEIAPNNDKIVVCDRHVFSAYSYFLARGISDIAWLKSINNFLPLPDITFCIDVAPDEALNRITNRDSSYSREETDSEILVTTRNHFLSQPWGANKNYHIVDGSNYRTPQEINQEITDIVTLYLESFK